MLSSALSSQCQYVVFIVLAQFLKKHCLRFRTNPPTLLNFNGIMSNMLSSKKFVFVSIVFLLHIWPLPLFVFEPLYPYEHKQHKMTVTRGRVSVISRPLLSIEDVCEVFGLSFTHDPSLALHLPP